MNLTKPAKYISYLFIPPIMNLFVFIIFSFNLEEAPKSYYGIIISFLFGLLFPLIAILQFRRKGIISNNDATIKEERTLPYIFAVGFSLGGVVFSSITGLDEKLIMLWMIYLISSIIILNINRFWKISAHAMGASIPIGALLFIGDMFWFNIFAIILIIVGLSRLYLRVHTLLQVLTGSVLGFSVSYLLLNYFM